MFVHHCNRCCVYFKEIQPCSPKYRGIWAICMHKMMFSFQKCNSVSKGSFREFRPFSVIVETHWPYLHIPQPSLSRSGPTHAFTLPQTYLQILAADLTA